MTPQNWRISDEVGAKSSRRAISSDPRRFIEDLGYHIDRCAEQAGRWTWSVKHNSCGLSFQSAGDALDDAWNNAVARTLHNSPVSTDQWIEFDIDMQMVAITYALSGELPDFSKLSLKTQMDWVNKVRPLHSDAGTYEIHRLARMAFIASCGVLERINM